MKKKSKKYIKKDYNSYTAILLKIEGGLFLADIQTIEGRLISEKEYFKTIPKSFKNINLNRGDLISFEACGVFPEIYGIKRLSNVKIINNR